MNAGAFGKLLVYPEQLIGQKSGFVAIAAQKEESGKLNPIVLYSSHDDFLHLFISAFEKHPSETHDLLSRYKEDVLIFEFITYTLNGQQKIYNGERRQFFTELSAGRKQFYYTLECMERRCYR